MQHPSYSQDNRFPILAALGRWIVPVFVFTMLTFHSIGIAYAQSKPGPDDVLIGQDEEFDYYMKKTEYKGSGVEKQALQYSRSKQALAADQAAIRLLGIAVEAEKFQMFENVAKKEKLEIQKTVLNGLLDKGLEGLSAAVKGAKSLNPWNVNKAVDALQEKGFKSEAVIAALRGLAKTKDKPEMAAAYELVDAAIKGAREGWTAGAGAATDPDNAQLRLLLGALKVAQGNPTLGTVVMTAEFGEHLLLLGYASGQVKELAKVTDEKLEKLSVLTQRLKGHVDEMNAAKKAWQKETGHSSATPVIPK